MQQLTFDGQVEPGVFGVPGFAYVIHRENTSGGYDRRRDMRSVSAIRWGRDPIDTQSYEITARLRVLM